MTDRFQNQWEYLAKKDAYWADLTDDNYTSNRWDQEAFFNTGEQQIESVFARLETLSATPDYGAALDFGCGVGRLTRALSKRFKHVVGSDMSASMLTEAKRVNGDFKNITFAQNSPGKLDTVSEDALDFIYSIIVLQHMPKQRQAVFIRAFCRALKPGGILQFQALSHRHINTARDLLAVITPEPIKSTWRIITGKAHTDMEMHTFRQQEIVELLAQEPVDLLAHWPDHAAGPRFSSYTYVVRKRRAPPNAH